MSDEHRVDVFLYGSYMNLEVLQEAGIKEPDYEAARLPGYQLKIAPLANLVVDTASQAYGIVAKLTHQEIDYLFGAHASIPPEVRYKPEAVLAFTIDNTLLPALCYFAYGMQPATPEPRYLDLILESAREYGFPEDYVANIEELR